MNQTQTLGLNKSRTGQPVLDFYLSEMSVSDRHGGGLTLAIALRDMRERYGLHRTLPCAGTFRTNRKAPVDGGLGNQLFQDAMGRSLSDKRVVALQLDLSAFESANEIPEGLQHFVRSFQLSAFKIVTNLLVIGLMRWFIGQLSVVSRSHA